MHIMFHLEKGLVDAADLRRRYVVAGAIASNADHNPQIRFCHNIGRKQRQVFLVNTGTLNPLQQERRTEKYLSRFVACACRG